MLIEPTEQEKLRARKAGGEAPATVTITTFRRTRALKPEHDIPLFEQAAQLALDESVPAGYPLVRHAGVTEFLTVAEATEGVDLEYRYVWEFTAHRSQ